MMSQSSRDNAEAADWWTPADCGPRHGVIPDAIVIKCYAHCQLVPPYSANGKRLTFTLKFARCGANRIRPAIGITSVFT